MVLADVDDNILKCSQDFSKLLTFPIAKCEAINDDTNTKYGETGSNDSVSWWIHHELVICKFYLSSKMLQSLLGKLSTQYRFNFHLFLNVVLNYM